MCIRDRNELSTFNPEMLDKQRVLAITKSDMLDQELMDEIEPTLSLIHIQMCIRDRLMIDILASVFDSFKDSKGVIFDGFPRTIAQAEALKKMLAERGQDRCV